MLVAPMLIPELLCELSRTISGLRMTPGPPELKNIQAIIDLERDTRENRSLLDRLTDGVGNLAGKSVRRQQHFHRERVGKQLRRGFRREV